MVPLSLPKDISDPFQETGSFPKHQYYSFSYCHRQLIPDTVRAPVLCFSLGTGVLKIVCNQI